MPYFNSPVDGAQLHYVDYYPASSPPAFGSTTEPNSDVTLVFIHGWPMSARWSPAEITYDVLAQDTVQLIKLLNLQSFVFIAASMGCGETLLAYELMSPNMKAQCKGFVWLGPSLPYPLKTESNVEAPARELWDMILAGFRADRVAFVKASIGGVFGIPFDIGIELPDTVLTRFENIVGQADPLAIERCVQIITNYDFTPELKKLDENIPMLVIHGDKDQSMPACSSALLIPNYAKQAKVKIYEKAAHGLYVTHAEKVLEDVLAFVLGPGGTIKG